jgi:hypothetical protein
MSELESSESLFESAVGNVMSGGGGAAAGPPDGMSEWWKTPASLVGPPAVDPAIYGIDPSDVGVEEPAAPMTAAPMNAAPMNGIAAMLATPKRRPTSNTIIDDVVADVERDHAEPANLAEYIGMSNAVSAQAGSGAGPNPDRIMHMKKADAGRAHAMQNQLLIASRNIEALTVRIDDTIAAGRTKPDSRGADGYVLQLESIVAEGENERGKIVLVMKEKFPDSSVRNGVEHIDRAVDQFKHAVERAKAFARQNGAKFDHDKHNANDEVADVLRLEHELGMTGIQTNHVGKVTESESDLQKESFSESLDGLDHGTQALVLALREHDAKTAMTAVLPGLLSNVRMLDASMKGIKTTDAQRKKGPKILNAMKDAMRDARGHKLENDSSLVQADVNVRAAITKLDALPRAKK